MSTPLRKFAKLLCGLAIAFFCIGYAERYIAIHSIPAEMERQHARFAEGLRGENKAGNTGEPDDSPMSKDTGITFKADRNDRQDLVGFTKEYPQRVSSYP